jgi:hypothetical protein
LIFHNSLPSYSTWLPNDLAHLPGGFTVEPSVQDYLRKRRNIDFGAAQPGQVQPLLGGKNIVFHHGAA